MIEIKPVDSVKGLEDFEIDLYPGTLVMCAKEKDTILGVGVACIIEERFAVLKQITMKEEFQEWNLEFGMGKSVLNALDLRGIRYVFSDLKDEKLLEQLRFQLCDSIEQKEPTLPYEKYRYVLDLNGYFTAHCAPVTI